MSSLIIIFCLALNVIANDLPHAALDWDFENENPKFVDETCEKDSECYGSFSLCKNGRCDCKETYEPGFRFVGKNGVQLVCEPGPSVYELCTKSCQKPAVCVKPETKSVNYTKRNQEITVEVVDKICLCKSPYKYDSENDRCILECGKDETYDKDNFTCVVDTKGKKCNAKAEILHKGVCITLTALGKDCTSNIQCQDSFAECKKHKCSCKDNFDIADGECVPKGFHCPYGGNVLMKDKKFTPCKKFKIAPKCPGCSRKEDENSPTEWSGDVVRYIPPGGLPDYLFNVQNQPMSDDCPSNYYCSVVYGDPDKEGSRGYCCPTPKLECPVGEALQNVSCEALFGSTDEQYCPVKTHYCHYIFSKEYQKTVCCPKPCHSNFLYVDGECFQPSSLGDKCEKNEQCQSVDGKCIKGVCECPGKTKVQPTTAKCELSCDKDEVEIDNQCVPEVKLGDSCQTDPRLCPLNSKCNGKHKCVCDYDTFHFGEHCYPEPSCDWAYRTGVATKSYKIEIEDFLQNATLCKIANIKPFSSIHNIVSKCPKDQFCKRYSSTVGLCCRKTDRNPCVVVDPIPGRSCNVNVSPEKSCGIGHKCTATYDTSLFADQNSDERNVCCPE